MKVDLDEMKKRYVGEGPGYTEQSALYGRKHNDDGSG